ncbi:MMPL family transporter [Stackebrandtia soli]|uniref:MMPL family transporter n=1 Tax=Stackebrandtia soli TaxID=1892856 RepID=UPI0039EC4EF2
MSTWQRVTAAPGGKIGRFVVFIAWIGAMLAAGVLGGDTDELADDSPAGRLPASAESVFADQLAEERFADDGTEPLFVVYQRDGGLTADDLTAAETADTALQEHAAPGSHTPDPMPSTDGEAVLLVVSLPVSDLGESGLEDTLDAIQPILDDHPDGLTVAKTGPIAAQNDMESAFSGLDETLLVVTAVIVAVLLLITYRSPLLLLLPLVSVAFAIQATKGLVYLLAKYGGLVADSQSTGILTVLVFGVGTDYALLLIARYREELHRHPDRYAAMRVALPRTIPAVLASAGTVILAMLTLLVADLGPTAALGPVAAIGIGTAFLTMTTLLPALLVTCGRFVFWPAIPRVDEAAPTRHHRLWAAVARLVARRTRTVWLGSTAVLLALIVGVSTLSTGLTLADGFTTKPESVVGQELMAEHYEAGRSAPVDIFTRADTADAVAAIADDTDGVDHLLPATDSIDGDYVNIRVVLSDDPAGSAAEDTVRRLRAALDAADPDAVVGGSTATTVDLNATMDSDLRTIVPLILVVVFAVLLVLLRSLVAPILLLVANVLSFLAALGAGALILNLIGHATIDDNLLLYSFLFLVALGVDYTIFLMTRAREEVVDKGHRDGVTHALTVTGGVITSAGIVLAATFAALIVMPLVFMLQIGVVVAVGVLLDTLIVRSLLVPALSLDIGRRTWWPGAPSRTGTTTAPNDAERQPVA